MTMSKLAPAMPTRIAAVTTVLMPAAGIDQREIHDRRDDRSAGHQHPRHALPQPAEQAAAARRPRSTPRGI